MNLSKITDTKTILFKLAECRNLMNGLVDPNPFNVDTLLIQLENALNNADKAATNYLEMERHKLAVTNRERFGYGIIRSKIIAGEKSRTVTVSNPDEKCSTPYISATLYRSLQTMLGSKKLTTDSPFSISVLSSNGEVIDSINKP